MSMETLRKLYQELLAQPEPVRRKFFIFFVLVALPPIFVLWFYSFRLSIDKVTGEEKEKPKASSEIVSEFQKGVANVKELLGSLSIQLPFSGYDFRPQKREVLPRIHLPIEKIENRK